MVCGGCLSADRTLVPLQDHVEIFLYLSGKTDNLKYRHTMVCWECHALLARIQKFKTKIHKAQFVLQKKLCDLMRPSVSLSTLTRVTVNDFESINHKDITVKTLELPDDLKQNIPNLTDIKLEPKVDIKIDMEENETVCKEELFEYNDGIDIDEQNEYYDTYLDPDYKLLEIKRENVQLKRKKRQKCQKEVLKRINDPNVDMRNVYKHFSKVFVSCTEIEEVINMDNKRGVKRKLKCTMKSDGKNCGKYYRQKIDMKRHKMLKHSVVDDHGPYECMECAEKIPDAESLFTHWDKHTFVYKCRICGEKVLGYHSSLQYHTKRHKRHWACTECNLKFCKIDEFRHHFKEVHSHYVCDHCGWAGTTKTKIQNHIKRNHIPPHCRKCDRLYSSYEKYKRHCSLVHSPRSKQALTGSGQHPRELSYCVECDKQFPSVYKYNRHLATAQTHNPPKEKIRVPCLKCDKVFSRKTYMLNHCRLMHEGNSKNYCELCDKQFCTAYSLRLHKQSVHLKIPKPKTKVCDLCGRAFTTNRVLIHHRRTHTGERPHSCPHCAAAFAQKTALFTHLKTQHKIEKQLTVKDSVETE